MNAPLPLPHSHLHVQHIDAAQQGELLRQLVNTSPSGIVVYDAIRDQTNTIIDFEVVLFNQAAIHISGESEEFFRQKTHRQQFPDSDYPGLLALDVQITEAKQVVQEVRFYPTWGKWLDISRSQVNGGYMVIFTDVTALQEAQTERQRLQAQLEEQNQALNRSNQQLDQFAAVASHDLQEPLRKIVSFGNLLTEQFSPALGHQGVRLVERMQAAASRMSSLIQELLAYSRLAAQQEPFQVVDLTSIIHEVLIDIEMQVAQTNAQIHWDVLPTLQGNPRQLQQLVQNLLTNALKFAKPQQAPQVHIQTQWLSQEQLPVAVAPTNYRWWVALQVRDNGIGFDPTHGERIFELFHQVHGKQRYGGTGIGLAIVKRVVENHGGLVKAESQPGQGSTFTIYLPDQVRRETA